MNSNINPDSLFSNITQQENPPVETWDPPFCGDIDICIHSNGSWSYNKSPFTRIPLVKMFSRILKREADDYFLVTPVEKVRIRVEAEPFITTAVEQRGSDLAFRSNLDEIIVADEQHPIKVINDIHNRPYPTIHIRNNLHALISRSDFYQLVEWASYEPESKTDSNSKTICKISSSGCSFLLGTF